MRFISCAVAALATTLLATPAGATTCPMVTDASGDGTWNAVPVVEDGQLDILSADVATGPTTIVAVLRLRDLDRDALSTLGVTWLAGWTAHGTRYTVRAHRGASGQVAASFTVGSSSVPVSVALDVTAGSVTWTAARSAAPSLVDGTVVSSVSAVTTIFGGTADSAFDPAATYVAGDPGCVSAA